MAALDLIKISARSLVANRLRSFLSSLGVLIGVAALMALLSIGEGVKQETLEQIGKLGMNTFTVKLNPLHPDSSKEEMQTPSLSMADARALQLNLPGLVRCAPISIIHAAAPSNPRPFQLLSIETLGITRDYQELKGLETIEGRLICDLDIREKKHICVLGSEIAKSLGRKGHAGHSLTIHHCQWEIIGILKPMNQSKNQHIASRNLDKTIFIPLSSAPSSSLSIQDLPLSEIILQIEKSEQMEIMAKLTKKILGRLHRGSEFYQIIVPQELLRQAESSLKTFNRVLGSIAAIALLVGGIGIMNMMLASIFERTKEIGIRRSLGANKKHILLHFLTEALLITFLGTVLGLIAGMGLSKLISAAAGWKMIISMWSILLSVGISFVIGLSAGLYPALRAAKMDPIAALRE